MRIKNLVEKDCKVEFVYIPPSSVIKLHYHKGQTESEYVIEGTGRVISGKTKIELNPGVLFMVRPNEKHEVISDKKGLVLFVTKANYSDDTEWIE